MKHLFFIVIMLLAFSAYSIVPTIIPGIKGITLTWPYTSGFTHSLYRGTSPDSYELLASNLNSFNSGFDTNMNNKTIYLDKTAEPNVQYFYKIVAESENLTATIEKFDNVVFLKAFISDDLIASPELNPGIHERTTGQISKEDYPQNGYGFWYTQNIPSVYTRYVDNIKPGAKYIAKITFGRIIGKGQFRLSLSPRKPVADVLVDSNTLSTYKNQTIDFHLKGGIEGWNEIFFSVLGRKGDTLQVYVKKLVIIEE